jgi:predicted Mrr-cat superfamily restriction endonuclease
LAFKNSEKFFEISVQMFDEWKAKENQRLALLETDPHFDPVEYSWGQIERYFQVLDIKDIRILVTSLLKALDCHIQWTGPVTANDSMEMLCSMDPLGIKSPHLHIHITKRCQKTSMEDLTTYIHDLESSSIGIYFSFGGFEEGVKEYALNQKKPTLRLIDLEGFVELWVENIKKIDQEGYAKFPLRPVHFLTIPGNSQLSIDPQGSI